MRALIFDCDGVLADTEREGHLPAFNETFAAFGLPVRWSPETYGEKLHTGGGKERMATLFADAELVRSAGLPTDPAAQRALLQEWHRHKTAVYTEIVQAGKLPPRPGVVRLVDEALAAGWALGVASTSAEASVRAVLEHAVGAEVAARFAVVAGDAVPRKKPDPAVYELAVRALGARPEETIAIEDSRNGLLAAVGAGLRCVVTVNAYTAHEDMGEAALVVTSLGDPDEPMRVLANRSAARPGATVTLADLEACLGVPIPEESP